MAKRDVIDTRLVLCSMLLIIASILIGGSYCFHLSDEESEAQRGQDSRSWKVYSRTKI